MADYTLSVEVTGDVTKMQKAFEQAQESAKGLKDKIGNSFNFNEAMTKAGDNLKGFRNKDVVNRKQYPSSRPKDVSWPYIANYGSR